MRSNVHIALSAARHGFITFDEVLKSHGIASLVVAQVGRHARPLAVELLSDVATAGRASRVLLQETPEQALAGIAKMARLRTTGAAPIPVAASVTQWDVTQVQQLELKRPRLLELDSATRFAVVYLASLFVETAMLLNFRLDAHKFCGDLSPVLTVRTRASYRQAGLDALRSLELDPEDLLYMEQWLAGRPFLTSLS